MDVPVTIVIVERELVSKRHSRNGLLVEWSFFSFLPLKVKIESLLSAIKAF